jgi:hypothetical protein
MNNKIELDYIGRITIKSIRDFTLDKKLTEKDKILLNPRNFDDLVLEYRELYKDSLKTPYLVHGVLIKEDTRHEVPHDRVGLLRDDLGRLSELAGADSPTSTDEVICRCGFCGNIVAEDGSEVDLQTRNYHIKILQSGAGEVHRVRGYCCINQQ